MPLHCLFVHVYKAVVRGGFSNRCLADSVQAGHAMSWIWWLVSTCSLLLGYALVLRRSKDKKWQAFPPGPASYPVLGHLILLSTGVLHQKLVDLSKKYGPVLGLRLGLRPAVVVTSPAVAKQVLCTHDDVLSHRPPFFFARILFPDDILLSGRDPHWRIRRKLCLTHLFNARRLYELQHVRQQELASLLQAVQDAAAAAVGVDIGRLAGNMSTATILRLLCSHPTAPGEDLQLLVREVEHYSIPSVGDVIPWLSFLDIWHRRQILKLHHRLDQLIKGILSRRMQEINEGEDAHDDLLHALLSREADSQAMPRQETVTLGEIKSILKDMLAAGIHTTSLTIEWAMAELMRNPNCFRRLRQELDETLGDVKKDQISDDDLQKLPYLKCVVKEVLRLHPPAPLLLPRVSSEECKLDGYIIPAGTMVFVNAYGIGRDEQVWLNAAKFYPERFEGKDIDLKGHHYELLPFGSGRRGCIGLLLGLSVVEVTMANLVRSFDWELPGGETPESMNMEEGRGLAPSKACPTILIPKPRPFSSKLI